MVAASSRFSRALVLACLRNLCLPDSSFISSLISSANHLNEKRNLNLKQSYRMREIVISLGQKTAADHSFDPTSKVHVVVVRP